jgi:hypothetical protein
MFVKQASEARDVVGKSVNLSLNAVSLRPPRPCLLLLLRQRNHQVIAMLGRVASRAWNSGGARWPCLAAPQRQAAQAQPHRRFMGGGGYVFFCT